MGKKCEKNSHILLIFNSKSSGSEFTACPLLLLKGKSWKQPVTLPGRFDNSVLLSPDASIVGSSVCGQEGRGVIQVSLPRAIQILCHSKQPSLLLAHWKGARIGMVKRYNWRRHFIATRHTRIHWLSSCNLPRANRKPSLRENIHYGNDVNPSYRDNSSARTQGCQPSWENTQRESPTTAVGANTIFFLILLKYSWLTMLCYFQVYSRMIQLYIYSFLQSLPL